MKSKRFSKMLPEVCLGLNKKDYYTYVEVVGHPFLKDDSCYPLHKLVAESYLKRKLGVWEVVHHIDGNTKNNRIENLVVFVDQNAHVSWHRGNSMSKHSIRKPLQENKYGVPALGIVLYGPSLLKIKRFILEDAIRKTKEALCL